MSTTNALTDRHPQRRAYYEAINQEALTPLWEVLSALVPPQPITPCIPAGWHYARIRPHLLRAGELISAEEAERRVLVLENPGLRGLSSITQSLYAGLQLLLPGEIAPSHRHTQSALRLVLQGEGAYTAVDGERVMMSPGDFITTPAMTWHDHGNPGCSPVVWLDGLDIPLVRFLDAGFAEKYPAATHPLTRPTGDTLARYGSNLLPIDHQVSSPVSPLFIYPYSQARAALLQVASAQPPDDYNGHALRFVNPSTGGPPLPTIGAYVQLLPAKFCGRPYRSTDGRVFCCLEGHGRVSTDQWSFDFGPRDVFVVPSWHAHTLQADPQAILFSFSDRPVQRALGLWREARE
jgi:gentisate 1,2-dioxygenase